jgi:hypothetical protein
MRLVDGILVIPSLEPLAEGKLKLFSSKKWKKWHVFPELKL